jgi:hypothetical protein
LELAGGRLLAGRLAHLPLPRLRVFHLHQQTVVAAAQITTCLVANPFHIGNEARRVSFRLSLFETHWVSNLDR